MENIFKYLYRLYTRQLEIKSRSYTKGIGPIGLIFRVALGGDLKNVYVITVRMTLCLLLFLDGEGG